MLHIITTLDAKRYTAQRITAEEAEYYTSAPLVASTFIFKLRPQIFICLAIRALESHSLAFTIESRQSYEFALLLCDEEL